MTRGSPRRSAIVADRRPLERGLARFLLEERGLFVVGEAATMADVLIQVQQLRPDLLVLHEKLALDHDPTVIAQIRRISARTSIVLLAASREAVAPELLLLADTVVEDGPGLTELGAAVAGPAPETDTAPAEIIDAGAPVVVPPARSSGARWADRLQGLAVASIIALAFVIARGMTTPSLAPTVVGRVHLSAAWDSLDELRSVLPGDATPEQIAEIASALIDERAAAEAAGLSVTDLDQRLLRTLAAVWSTLPQETQQLLMALFGDIIVENDVSLPPPLPTPPPTETTTPPPTETTTPPPTETTTPPPTETTTPPPTETTTPPPTETTTPPPTETTTPPPTETTTPPPTETTTPPPTETTTPPPTETTTPPPTETTTPPPTETTTPPPTETTTPPPTETTTPPPTETTTPPPTETTTPPPTETTTPPPTETTTPPPTETTTPPPTETTTPPPTLVGAGATQTGSLSAIPSVLAMLLVLFGWARRRSRRSLDRDDEDRGA